MPQLSALPLALISATLVLSACSRPAHDSYIGMANYAVIGYIDADGERLSLQTRNRQVSQFATDSWNAFRDLKNSFPDRIARYPEFAVVAQTDLENQAGESTDNAPIFEVVWSRDEIEKTDFEQSVNVFTEDFLMKASSVKSFNYAGDMVLVEYCLTSKGVQARELFCDKVIEGLYNK